MRKARSYAEVYNDLDDDVVNLFRIIRSDRAGELVHALRNTPFSRTEFSDAYEYADDEVERARRLIIRSFMGFGSGGSNRDKKTGFRANSNRSGTTHAHDWTNYPDAMAALIERIKGVVIENRDARDVMTQHDGPDTLHYIDPPYLPETRSKSAQNIRGQCNVYRHELTIDDHAELLSSITQLTGMVVLSGYPSPLYDEALSGWTRVDRRALADGARQRTEVLWINPRASEKISTPSLFAGVSA